MVIIKNEFLLAKFNTMGAELKSLSRGDTEYIWKGDEKFWKDSSPVLFPICSALKDNEYYFNGEKYTLPMHGFAQYSEFTIENKEENKVTFLLCSNEESKKNYPFDFEFRVVYILEGKTLKVRYIVDNKSNDTMYFSVGSHEGYYCPEGIEDYDIIFPQTETLDTCLVEQGMLGNQKRRIIENSNKISLKYDYFDIGTLIFKDIKSTSVILRNRNTGKAIRTCFDEFKYFLIWTRPQAPYVCLEHWCGMCDDINTDKNFKTKLGIETISPNGRSEKEHTVEILQ